MSARAIATRCCWPPESSAGRCDSRSARPTSETSWSNHAVLRLLARDRERQQDVLLRVEHRQQVEELEDEADVLAAQLRQVVVAERRDLGARDADRAGRRLVEPREDVHQRRLARPRRAHDRRRLARRDVDRDAPQRVDRGVALSVSARHVVRDDDRPVLAFAHSSWLLSLIASAEGYRASPFRPFANSRSVDHSASVETRLEIRRALERARSATEELLDPSRTTSSSPRSRPASRRSSWSYAHVARFEELWILRTVGGARPIPDVHDHVYDAFRRERSNGSKLPTLNPTAVRAYARGRARAGARHARAHRPRRSRRPRPSRVRLRPRAPERAPVAGVDARGAAVPHRLRVPGASSRRHPIAHRADPTEIDVPGGSFTLGAVHEPWAYDNELEPHEIELRAFRIDRAPVTNGEFAEFVDAPRLPRTQALERRRAGRGASART